LNPAEPLVCNTTILSNFASVRRLELLQRVFQGREVYTSLTISSSISHKGHRVTEGKFPRALSALCGWG